MTQVLSIDDVRGKVHAIIARQGKIDGATIRDESTLRDLGLASLDAIEVIFEIEECFDLTFPEQGIDFATGTVQHLVDAVVAVQAAGAGGEP